LKKILKYGLKVLKKTDISPLDCSNQSFKIFVFLLWGFSLLFFTTKEITSNEISLSPVYKNGYLSITEKFSVSAITPEVQIEIYRPPICIISTSDVKIDIYVFYRIQNSRGPPLFI
jgi:hypothetical protein